MTPVIQAVYEERVEMVVLLTRAAKREGNVFHDSGEIWVLSKSPTPLGTP